MNTINPILRDVVYSSFRLTVGLLAVFLPLWIAATGLVAVLAHPFLILPFWILGILGLMACASACVNAFPGKDRGPCVPHPVRCVASLMVTGGVGVLFWTQAAPAMAREPLGLQVAGTAAAWGILFGSVLLILLAMVLVIGRVEGAAASEAMEATVEGVASFPGGEKMA
jgi:hypothetical protein